MTVLRDFFIIYLACGAPAGVYFFLQNRTKINFPSLCLKSFLTAIVWIPYAFKFLHEFVTKRFPRNEVFEKSFLGDTFEEKLRQIQENLLIAATEDNRATNIFELREVLGRYVGLTRLCQTARPGDNPTAREKEIFRVTGHKNTNLAAKCLRRRNLSTLEAHQNKARRDLLREFERLNLKVSNRLKFGSLIIEMTTLVGDTQATKDLYKMFDEFSTIEQNTIANSLERNFWKTKEPKSLQAKLERL